MLSNQQQQTLLQLLQQHQQHHFLFNNSNNAAAAFTTAGTPFTAAGLTGATPSTAFTSPSTTVTSPVTPAPSAAAASVDISTIFIIGFPDDFKERELVNMFLFAPGFEGAVLKTTNISTCPAIPALTASSVEESQRKQLIGFVKFSKAFEAVYALEILNGKILDQERGIVLKAEIAKKNLFIKTAASSAVSISSSVAVTSKKLPSSLSDEDSILFGCTCNNLSLCKYCAPLPLPLPPPTVSNNVKSRVMSITLPGQSDPALISAPDVETIKVGFPVPQLKSLSSFNSSSAASPPPPVPSTPVLLSKLPLPVPERIIDLCALQKHLIASPALGSLAAIVGENFPCNTLYVGNLPPMAQEDELRALFRNCLGYRRLSFRPKASGPMCFVEFEDIACATAAMETLYGTMISCSTAVKGGIRLSFSKNPLGLRVASPSPTSSSSSSSSASSSSSFMEAIGAETDNIDHRQAISTIFAHYYRNNPQRTSSEFRP